MPDLPTSWGRAALAALAVPTADGVRCEVVVPLGADDPVLALPFDRSDLAEDLRAAGSAVVVLWDSRLATRGWAPLVAHVAVDVTADRDGGWIAEGLLGDLLRRHPPERARLDTPLLRREHWWAVPRWIVRLTPFDVRPAARRDGERTGVLAWRDGAHLDADVVEVGVDGVDGVDKSDGWAGDRIAVRSRSGRDLAAVRGPAALLASDVRTPDLDHTAELRLRGHLADGALAVAAREGAPVLGPPPGVLARLRAARAAERACRRALDARG
jgi:hypothetical protein